MSTQAFAASDDEADLATQLLKIAKCEEAGALPASLAVDFFGRSGLTVEQLRDIWNLADQNGSGDLSKDELAMAIRLMGWAQAGEALDSSLLRKTGPLPTLEGITAIKRLNPVQFPAVSAVDIESYKQAFLLAGPVEGILEGGQAMSAFMTSNLSYEQLRKIGGLVDKDSRGALDFRQFCMGMYLIHAFQSCLIPTIPTSIPQELHDKFLDIQLDYASSPPPPLSRSASPPSQPPTSPRIIPAISLDSTAFSSLVDKQEQEQWDILPHEKIEADKHFLQLDPDRKGYIETAAAAKFLMGYDLPQAELGRIWLLADLNRDNRLTPDEFAIAMHLLRQRLAGEPIPETLPPALLSPSLKSKFRLSGLPPPLPSVKTKPPPPPVPKKDRSSIAFNSRQVRARTTSSIVSPTIPNPRYSMPLSPPSLSPSVPINRPKPKQSLSAISPSPMSFLTSPARPRAASAELLSPFEDPAAESYTNPPSRATTPIPTPVPSPTPRQPDTAALEALERSFKKETGRLEMLVESLRAQLSEQGQFRDKNAKLQAQNESLKSSLRDMERTVSDMLSANDSLGSQEQYIREIDRLTADVDAKETESASLKRVLDVVKQEEQQLRTTLRESQAAATKASNEVAELRSTMSTQTTEIQQLKSRLADMSNAMAEPSSAANNRELRVLLRDATKENETLKTDLRNMEKAMEQLLLSSKFPTRVDELQRENRRLREQVQDMQVLAMTVQTSSSAGADAPSSRAAELGRENEQLKQQLKDGRRAMADLREANETKIVGMQQQIDSLTHENRRLKMDAGPRGMPAGPQEDRSVPPPSYDDSFVIPP